MSIFSKKQLTPNDALRIARKEKIKALKKREKLKKKYKHQIFGYNNANYKEELRPINQKIAQAISDENFAKELVKEEAKHPKPVPKSVKIDNSRFFASQTEVNIGSKNEAKVEGHLNVKFGKVKKKSAAPSEGKKKSNVKLIFFCVVAILVLVGVITLTVRITNCVRDNQDNTSAVLIEYLI